MAVQRCGLIFLKSASDEVKKIVLFLKWRNHGKIVEKTEYN